MQKRETPGKEARGGTRQRCDRFELSGSDGTLFLIGVFKLILFYVGRAGQLARPKRLTAVPSVDEFVSEEIPRCVGMLHSVNYRWGDSSSPRRAVCERVRQIHAAGIKPSPLLAQEATE